MNKEDKENEMQYSKKRLIKNITTNYLQLEQSIVNQLYMTNDLHGTTAGGAREDVWREMFETIIPKKFVIESSVFIIDSNFYDDSDKSRKGVSNEVDLAIIDEMYTPYIFRYGKLKFVPIEAVAAVVECKSQSSDFDGLANWSKQINELKASTKGIARVQHGLISGGMTSQKGVKPLKIFCGLGKKHSKNLETWFDFVILAHKKDAIIDEISMTETKLEITTSQINKTLNEWNQQLNDLEKPVKSTPQKEEKKVINIDSNERDVSQISEMLQNVKFTFEDARIPKEAKYLEYTLEKYKVSEQDKDISLLTFNFQLNQLLMIINNPILFPHLAYVDMFKKGLKIGSDNDGGGENGTSE